MEAADDSRQGERASASVEFALVLPLILIMGLALLQVGLLVKDRLVLEDVARAGARQGAVDVDDATVVEVAQDAAVSLDPALLSVSVVREGGSGTAVTVSVTYQDPLSVPLVEWLFPSAVGLSAEATMRQEVGG